MISSFLSSLIGILVFLFIFWKKMREDHSSEIIFSSASFILLGILIGSFFGFWFILLGIVLGVVASYLKNRIRVYEAVDALVISLLPWLSFYFLNDAAVSSSFSSFIGFLAVLLMILVYCFFWVKYKSFRWFKSGRVGFTGLATLFIFFLIRLALAIKFEGVLSFHQSLEVYLSGLSAAAAAFTVFRLGRVEK